MDAVTNVDHDADSIPAEDPTGLPMDLNDLVDESKPFSRYHRDVEDAELGLRVHIRIPNQFQRTTMKEEADAARARKLRALRDTNSTAALAIESKLDQMYGEMSEDDLRNVLLGKAQPHATARVQVEVEHADPRKEPDLVQYRNIERQQLTYQRLVRAGQMETEEFKEIEQLLTDYALLLSDRVGEMLEPLRLKLLGLEREALVEDIRKALMREACDEAFIAAYNQWQVYFGTRDYDDHDKLYYPSFDSLMDEEGQRLQKLLSEFAILEAFNIEEMRTFLEAMPS